MRRRSSKLVSGPAVVLAGIVGACGGSGTTAADPGAPPGSSSGGASSSSGAASSSSSSSGGAGDAGPDASGPLEIVAVTFNTGITPGSRHDAPPDDGFSAAQSELNGDHYGSGLAWNRAIDDTKAWFAALSPDVVVFQEIFHPGDCPSVPANARAGFICETWQAGDPTVVQAVLGPAYQVACHLGKTDKCAAVKTSFGKFRGCAGALCLDGLAGATVPTCGSGSRIGRGVIELTRGGTLTLVNVHGSSGYTSDDRSCRKKQFKQVFENLDGAPAANGAMNLILGDFNTDPARLNKLDESADELEKKTSGNSPFRFITEKGSNVTPTYDISIVPGLPAGFNIDHVISDKLSGSCWHAGVTQGHDAVTKMVYFDHKPAVCKLTVK